MRAAPWQLRVALCGKTQSPGDEYDLGLRAPRGGGHGRLADTKGRG